MDVEDKFKRKQEKRPTEKTVIWNFTKTNPKKMDATKRPLLIPPEFGTYAEKHGIFEMYKRLIEQLIIHKPNDPLAFLIELLQVPTVPTVMLIA